MFEIPFKLKFNLNMVQTTGLCIALIILLLSARGQGSGMIGLLFLFLALPCFLMILFALSFYQPFAIFVKQRVRMEQAYFALRLFRILLLFSTIFHVLLGIALCFAAPFIAENLLHTPLLSLPLRFVGIGLFFMAFIFIMSGFLQGMNLISFVKRGYVLLWILCIILGTIFSTLLSPYGERVSVFMNNSIYKDLYIVLGIGAGIILALLFSCIYFLVVSILVIRHNDAYFDDLPRQDIPTGKFFSGIPGNMLTLFFCYGFFFLDILLIGITQEGFTYVMLGDALFGGLILTGGLSLFFSIFPRQSLRNLQIAVKNRDRRDAGEILQNTLHRYFLIFAPLALYFFAAAPAIQGLILDDTAERLTAVFRTVAFMLLVYPFLPYLDSFFTQGRKGSNIYIGGVIAFILHLAIFEIMRSRGVAVPVAFGAAMLCYTIVRFIVELFLTIRMARLHVDILRSIGIPLLISVVLALPVYLFVENVKLSAVVIVLISVILYTALYVLATVFSKRL